MKEAFVSKGPKVEIKDVPIPKPGPKQLVIRVVYSGSNPKDWKIPEWMPDQPPFNQGDDIAGVVHEVGAGVVEFKPGDRVAAFHEMRTPHGSYAEYALAWAHTTFFLPETTSFAEGAAIPLAAMTAAVGLFSPRCLALPVPWTPAREPTPLIVYGAASAVGVYVLQLAARADIHPLICVAGRATAHVEQFLDRGRGDAIVDYRQGNEGVVAALREALGGAPCAYAFDAVSEKGSFQNISQVLEPRGRLALVLPGRDYSEVPDSVHKGQTNVGTVHGDEKDLGFVFFRYFSRGLDEGWFKPQPQEIVPGGLEGVQSALERLKDGTASAVKYVFKIADTPGAGQ